MPSKQHLTARNLSCVRGENHLFAGLNLAVQAGQCVHITGANGSGKTSLLKILCGLARPTTGEVLWNGENIYQSVSYLQESAYIGHKDGLKNQLTAIENLRIVQRLDGPADERKLDQCLAKLKILHCADLLAQSLSFGQRRRLSFSKLLLREYSVWILDEPFTGIDSDGHEVVEQLCAKHLEDGGSIVLTNHKSLSSSALANYLSVYDLSAWPAGGVDHE